MYVYGRFENSLVRVSCDMVQAPSGSLPPFSKCSTDDGDTRARAAMSDLLSKLREDGIRKFNQDNKASQKEQSAAKALQHTTLGYNYCLNQYWAIAKARSSGGKKPLNSQYVEELLTAERTRSSMFSARPPTGFARMKLLFAWRTTSTCICSWRARVLSASSTSCPGTLTLDRQSRAEE